MITIALLGFGYWGPNVARNIYRNNNFNFKYICDAREDRLQKAKNLYGESVEYVTDFDVVLNDPNVDAVAIVVATSMHYHFSKLALLHGKHVYVEKPFTDSLAKAEELKKLSVEVGKKIHVDHIMVFHPVIKKIKEIVESGDLGDILYFDCSRINLGVIKNDVSAMWDLAVHDLSIVDYLTNGAEPIEVSAMGGSFYSETESITFLNLKFDSFLANIRSSWLSPIKERRIIIAGSKKMIVYDDVDVLNKLIVYDKGFDIENALSNVEYDEYVVKTRMGDAVIPALNQEDALYNSLDHFRTCIEEDQESITNADAAIRMIKILEKADTQLL